MAYFRVVVILQLVDELLHMAAFLVIEKSGGLFDGHVPNEKLPDPVLFFLVEIRVRQVAQAFQADLFLILEQRFGTGQAGFWKKQVEEIIPKYRPSLHSHYNRYVSIV